LTTDTLQNLAHFANSGVVFSTANGSAANTRSGFDRRATIQRVSGASHDALLWRPAPLLRALCALLVVLVAFAQAPRTAAAGSICTPQGGGDKLCKTYGGLRCSGGACRKWVNRCSIHKRGYFRCAYEASESRNGHVVKTLCDATKSSKRCLTTDPDSCRTSSGYKTCGGSTNACLTYGRYFKCTFAQHYTACKGSRCKAVTKTCRSGSNFRSYCTASVRKTGGAPPPGVGAQGDGHGAAAVGACPDPDSFGGDTSGWPDGYFAGCKGFDGDGVFLGATQPAAA
jgi:hypothetical protein